MQPGTILAGRYRAGRKLGAGGMGVILEGTHLELGTSVAIKLLHEQLAREPERVDRFLREARAAAQLRGEHVCRVHDCGTLPGGEPFIVMELLSGCDLSALVDQLGALEPAVAIDYLRQACAGIAEAHARGIVHRDIKPTNIFRTHRPDGAPLIKILDFGLAKPMNGQDLSLTQTATVMGSPRYMSPEQLKSAKVTDPRSDLWSLGVVLYELLTTKPPFNGESITELALNITNDPVPPLPASVPARLVAIVMRCLDKDPSKRYQSAAELDAALAAAAEDPAAAVPTADTDAPAPIADPASARIAGAVHGPESVDSIPSSITGVLDELQGEAVLALPAAVVPARRPRRLVWIGMGAVALAAGLVIVLASRLREPSVGGESGAAAVPVVAPAPVAAPVPIAVPPPAVAPADAGIEHQVATPADASVEVAQEPRRRKPVTKPKPRSKGDLTKSRY